MLTVVGTRLSYPKDCEASAHSLHELLGAVPLPPFRDATSEDIDELCAVHACK